VDFGKLVSFDGRIGRGAFWGLAVINYAVLIVGAILLGQGGGVAILGVILLIISIPISLAASIKRWHDRNKSGWWILIGLVPFIGGLWALIECGFLPGTMGPNAYGTEASGSPFAA
jgi:uncharacterized membrane protein YhaH (DUF805 family)